MTTTAAPSAPDQAYDYNDRNAVEAALRAPLDGDDVSKREGPGGTKLSYLKGGAAIVAANDIFGNLGWDFILESHEVTVHESVRKDVDRQSGKEFEKTVYMAEAIVRGHVETHVERARRGDIGYDNSEWMPHRYMAVGQAVKSAVTDCMKRCLRSLGFPLGLALYFKEGEAREMGALTAATPQAPQAARPAGAPPGAVPKPAASTAAPAGPSPAETKALVAKLRADAPEYQLLAAERDLLTAAARNSGCAVSDLWKKAGALPPAPPTAAIALAFVDLVGEAVKAKAAADKAPPAAPAAAEAPAEAGVPMAEIKAAAAAQSAPAAAPAPAVAAPLPPTTAAASLPASSPAPAIPPGAPASSPAPSQTTAQASPSPSTQPAAPPTDATASAPETEKTRKPRTKKPEAEKPASEPAAAIPTTSTTAPSAAASAAPAAPVPTPSAPAATSAPAQAPAAPAPTGNSAAEVLGDMQRRPGLYPLLFLEQLAGLPADAPIPAPVFKELGARAKEGGLSPKDLATALGYDLAKGLTGAQALAFALKAAEAHAAKPAAPVDARERLGKAFVRVGDPASGHGRMTPALLAAAAIQYDRLAGGTETEKKEASAIADALGLQGFALAGAAK